MNISLHTTRSTLLTVAAIAATLTLSACAGATAGSSQNGSTTPTASAGAADVTSADIEFAQMMIPHHEQAVQMSEGMLAKHNVDPRVSALATTITAAQAPEITTMKSWLKAWGSGDDSMAEMDHGTDGMMSDADMMTLDNATGPDADRIYLTQMIAHHEGAIAMAKTLLADGKNADARALAEDVIASQTEEIAVMTDLLAAL